MFKKKIYYVIHTEKCNMFSVKGYVICYTDKQLKKEYGRFDLVSFYDYFSLDKRYDFICKGGVYDL